MLVGRYVTHAIFVNALELEPLRPSFIEIIDMSSPLTL